MAFPDHYLLQWGGPLRGDIWTCNLRFISTTTPLSSQQQQDKCAELKTKIQTWMTVATSGWGNSAELGFVKFNRIGPSGAYQDTNNTHMVVVSPTTVSGAVGTTSNHDAIAVSWTTAAARGLASRGRIFLPAPSFQCNATTGRLTATQALGIANAAATFINSANDDPNAPTFDLHAAVVSEVGSGTARQISGVRVGDIMDSMASRRNALRETYSVATTVITQ